MEWFAKPKKTSTGRLTFPASANSLLALPPTSTKLPIMDGGATPSTAAAAEAPDATPTVAAEASPYALVENAREIIRRNREAALARRAARQAAPEPRVPVVASVPEAAEQQRVAQPLQAAPEPLQAEPLQPMCMICHSALSEMPQQAMECMHVFHKCCIDTYMETTGKSFHEACPFKCNVRAVEAEAENDPPPAVVDVDAAANGDLAGEPISDAVRALIEG